MSEITRFHFAHGVRWVLDPVHGWIAPPRKQSLEFYGFDGDEPVFYYRVKDVELRP